MFKGSRENSPVGRPGAGGSRSRERSSSLSNYQGRIPKIKSNERLKEIARDSH